MTRNALTDLQIIMLVTARRRAESNLLLWPRSLAGHEVEIPKAVASLLRRRLIEEVEVADPAGARPSVQKKHFGLVVTEAARALVEVEGGAGCETPGADATEVEAVPDSPSITAVPLPTATAAIRAGTKQALVIDLLKGEAGASLADLAAATGGCRIRRGQH